MTTLRREALPDGRMVLFDAARTPSGTWEAWVVCVPRGSAAGSAPISPPVKIAPSVEELRDWVMALSDDDLLALVKKHCG